ncbi:muscle M-line assembly protein unc-89 isoform X7 [Calliphora vicina]|uniref:muscle M-line assembly protein unc-89 isoform X7 n=1 Tax=Calliphora vicina TaxID=7373 RepID=UPI00325A790F
MGETEGETAAADARGSEEPEASSAQENLQVPVQKKRKLKSPTPGSLRGRSATPIRGRSQTPFTLYMTRRSATPSTWRSITPFLKREEKEKTPFELGRDIRTLLTCNTAVFDRALVMDISEPLEAQKPIRYITSDLSVIDRAAVMDVSNVEVIYVVEEYEEYEEEEEEEIIEEVVKPKKKSKGGKKGRTPRRSAEKDGSPAGSEGQEGGEGNENREDREESVDYEDSDEPRKGKKKGSSKKKERKEKSPSPKLSLKLEMGGGQKASKKMFDEKQQQSAAPGPKPPPKKSKLALQMEEQAKAAAKAAEEEAAKAAAKKPIETFEERQKRLKAEQEEREREEAERRAQEEAEALEAALAAEEGGDDDYEGEGEGDEVTEYDDASSVYDESRFDEESRVDDDEYMDELGDLPGGSRRSSSESEGFTRPDPEDEERWKQIAEEEGEEFMQQMRKYSLAVRKSEKQRDAEWQRLRDQRRLPHFIVFLSDRTVEAGNSVRLACAVGGPELSVKWFKDGRQLERDNTHRIINNNNMLALEVINTTILDSGEYSCVIANMNDEVTSSCYVTIYEVFKDQPAPPSFRLVREYYHLRDDELTVEVHVHGVPRPIISWWRGAFEIKPNVKFTKLEEAHGVYKLLIYKPNSRDSGTYTCKAINSSGEAFVNHVVEVAKNLHYHVHGIFHARDRMQMDKEQTAKKAMEEALKSKGESDKKRAQVEVRSRGPRASPETLVSDRQKLKFATQLRDRMALEGTTVKLVVTIIGPDPACRWMKDDNRVTYGEKIKNHTEGDKAIIELINVTAEHSGVYKCIAKNEFSEIETSCYFKVYSAQTEGDEHEPIFALPLRDVYHSSQNDLILDTKIRGNPRPVVTWIKDQIPVVLDDRIVQIEHLDGICELIINKPTPNDSGNYTCVAQNKLGTQQTSHSVVVDVQQASRRSSNLSGGMTDSETGTKKGGKPPKTKKKDDEGDLSYERRSRMPDPSPKQQLYFTTYLSNRYVLAGSKVKLQSVVNGPSPTMKWTKDEQNVQYGPRIRNMNREGLACLEFLNCQPEDSGIYTLLAQNEFSKITSSCQLHVYTANVSTDVEPVFVRPIKDTYHLISNELILETGIRGVPTPQIQWFKDSMEIENGGRFHIFQHADGNCELVIDSPNDKDSGKYMARAESSAGKAEIGHHVLFRGKEHHIADNIHGVFHADKNLLRPKQAEAEKTKEAAGKSEASESEGDEGSKGKKRVRKPKKDDEEGEASSAYATDTGSETSSLKKREKVIGIHFATAVRDRVVAEGSKVKISCFLEAKEPQVKWFKNDEQIQNSQKIRGRHVEGLCTLEIPSAALDDSGEYKCWARDETGEASTFCRLEVYSNPGTGDVPPTFTRNIKDTYHGKINEVQLDCHVRGLPTPTITWAKDGVKIEPSEKYQQVEHEDGTLELFIMDPTPQDSGKYVCQAENREGTAEIVHMVTVQPRRRRPVSPARERPPALPPTQETEEEKEKKRKKKQEDDEESGRRREVPPPPDLRKRVYFRNYLSNRTVKEGSNVKWMVSIDGPDPTARWYHGENLIAFGPKSKLSMQDGIAWLNLIGVTEEQSGVYTLKVKGSENEIVSTCTLLVYSTGKEELVAPTFTVGIKDTYSINENELVLDCRVRGKPRPEIQWLKGTDMLMPGDRYVQIDQADGYSKLIIPKPTEKDSGLYACVARNEVAESKITHQVDFKGRERFALEKTMGYFHRDPNKPHFVTPLGNQTVCNGGTIAISAEFMQTHTPIDVQWFRDRQSLAGQPNVSTFYEHGVYTLAIMNAQAENEGTYTCRAQNAFGRIESHANVDVAVGVSKDERPPLFLSRPETEMKIAVGDPFSISFRIAGDPKPRLTFLKGTKDITKSDRVSKEVSDDYTRFTVQKAQISDSGTYFVVARNNNGTDRIFVTVEVMPRARSETPSAPRWGLALESYADVSYFKDPPAAVSTEPLLIDSGPTHISLSWGKPPTNNSAPVIAYRVDAWIVGHEGGAMWKELGLTPINSFDAFNLKSNVEYHFRVTPKNRYGWGPSVQTSAPLQVGGVECLPEFTVILPGQVKALLNKEFVLEAVVRGTPRPDIVWYKDGLRISSNLESERIKTRKIGSTCTLTIKQVTEADAGRYTCEATNSKGRVSTFARLQVVSDPKLYEADNRLKEIVRQDNIATIGDALPIFTMRLRDRRAQVTYPVRLTCQVVAHPHPEITWYKDDELLQSSRRCLITEENQFYTLELASAQLNDSGVYTCTAKNELGSVSCHCSLVVDKGIRAYISPEFYMPLDPLYIVQETQELRLTAKVEAYPAVGVSWHRNGVKLRPSRRLAASLDANGFVELIISETSVRDAGIYTCVASNAVGKQESMCRVCIEPLEEDNVDMQTTTRSVPAIWTNDMPYSKEPLFVVKPRSSEAYEGDTVIIFCEVVGDPKPDVVWLRDFLNPEYYRDAPHFRRIGEGTEYRLEIPYAKLDFTGTYSVIASNCHGEAKAVISLQIFAKDILKQNSMEKGSIRHGNVETLPRFIRHLRNLRCCDGDAITLEAHVEGLPEPVIIWEKDGRVLPSGKDFEMTYDGIKATLSIPRVYPEDEGEYTCIAKNNIGRTLSSACIIVDVPEEKENMLNRQLTRPTGFLSATSTPISTPRSTPSRSFSPTRRLSYRNSIIDISEPRSVRGRSLVDGHQAISAPKFLAIPNSRVVEEGDSVRFQCAIAGHPTPWATWDKDGIIVTPTTRIAIKEVNDLRYLEIEEVTFDDAGLYRITLENDYGRIEATARLDVIGSSRYSKSPSARSVRASSSKRNAYLHRRIMGPSTAIGGRMALASGFRGSSVPSCKFYHNGLELLDNDRVHIDLLQEEAFLFVEYVTKDDEGIYTCVVEGHEHEPIVTSTVVTFLTTEQIQHPPKTICEILQSLPNEIEHWEGETIDLCFELNTNMPYTYMWSRNGELIKESDDFNYIDHGNGFLCLRIHDAFDLDSGCYTCTVTTVDGFQCSTFTNLNIGRNSEISDDSGLAVMKSLLPVVADCGVKATFCARIFPADAQTFWYVCGRTVTENDDSCEFTLESSSTDGIRILHINDVTLAHSGEVQLVVTHPGKPHSSLKSYTSLAVIPRSTTAAKLIEPTKIPTDLTIDLCKNHKNKERPQQPAYILEGPRDCTALIGGCVRLSIIFEGLPKPQVRWFKASRPIVETSNIIINTSTRKSVLQISDIVTDDSGKYTVEIMNEFGTDVAVASVAVEGPPEPPSGKPSISQGPDRVSIAWCGPPYDGGCMITGFIIEMQELLSADSNENVAAWLEIASVVDSLAYTVKDLKPLCTYRFRVRAENVHGRSEPSLPSDRVHVTEEIEDLNEDFHKSISIKAGGDFKSRFEVLEELGKGRFGVVYKVQEKEEPKRICAAKIIKCIKSRDRVKVQEEISIMKSLKHPKLLQLAASFESSREIVMVMEFITGGELFERVVADDFTLTERDCVLFVRQVCEGVAYMHSQSIVHLDLKPENIMCKTRTCHQIKIIDFGLAQRLNTGSPVRVLFGTPEFIPPEIISYEPIGFQSDMWSVGVICYVLLSGLSPFMGDSDVETFSNITRAEFDFDDDAFDCVSQQAKDFISNLLVHRKEDRWTAEQCLESPWLKQGHDDENLSNKKICTDKLKKFIIRRKWQKTGNAIRALGRMATLSASRRNSVASNAGSVPNSPRPSVSGVTIFNPNISVQMGSLHEEDDDFSIELPSSEIKRKNPTVLNKSQCSERSDSGYSECSNCSASGSIQCQCTANKDSVDHAANDDLSLSVPHDLLKLKLEEIAHQADSNIEEVKLELVVPNEKSPQLDDNQNELKTLNIVNTEEKTIQVVEELDVLNKDLNPSTSPIMRSDFTNTIQMRKKSLENSLQKDKQLKPAVTKSIYLEQPGKVSMLKNKFSSMQSQVSSTTSSITTSSFAKSKDCMDVLKLKRKVVTEACPNQTASSLTSSSSSLHTQHSTSLPNSPIPIRKTNACSTFRLSDRVREVTDRLAQQQTVCTEARRTQKSPSPNRKQILSP